MRKCLLSEIKFWYIPWQKGIDFNAYGFKSLSPGKTAVEGNGYIFEVDKELDSFLLPNGEILPICCATIIDAQGTVVPFDSFTIDRFKDTVQINKRDGKSSGYFCRTAKCNEIFIEGDSYDPRDE